MLKPRRPDADIDDMEPVDPRPPSGPQPPTVTGAAPTVADHPEFALPPTEETPGHHRREIDQPNWVPMAVFRLLAAVAFAGTFLLSGVQVMRVLEEQERSTSLGLISLLVGAVCIVAVLVWTYAAAENARRINSPAENRELPDPRRAVLMGIRCKVRRYSSSCARASPAMAE